MKHLDEGSVTPWIVGTALLGAIGVGIAAMGWPRHGSAAPAIAGNPAPADHEVAAAIDPAGATAPIAAPDVTRTAIAPAEPEGHAPARLRRARSVAALDRLQEIVEAQRKCREQAAIDVDRDGIGEYGFLAELTGTVIRPHAIATNTRLQLLQGGRVLSGVMVRDGYCFRVFLPGAGGAPVGESDVGAADQSAPDPQLAEQSWCCYAWPAEAEGDTGPALFTDQRGHVIVTENAAGRYVGRDGGPQPDAALGRRTAGRLGEPTAAEDSEGRGRDGEVWRAALPPAESSTVVRIVDAAARLVPEARVQVMVRPAVPPSGGGEFFEALIAQRQALDWLEAAGLRLPVATSGVTDQHGEVELSGLGVTGVAIVLRHPDRRDSQGRLIARGRPGLPTRLTLRDGVLQVELPPGIELEARPNANESAAIATLKNVASAQAQCQASRTIDVNDNGAGEYGYFGELSGGSFLRTAGGLSDERLSPPFLSGAFSNLQSEQSPSAGVVVRSGYCFQVWLPDAAHFGVPEASTGGAGVIHPDPASCEVMWCAYAWPVELGRSGQRAFFVNQDGDVLACQNERRRYSGFGNTPTAAAAYENGGAMDAPAAANGLGGDGQKWTVVN